MTLQRAYSLFEIKAIDDAQGVIEGIASTPTTDRMGDIVEPKGAEFKLPLPLLWQHNAREPLGHVLTAKATDAGIAIKAKIMLGVLPEIDRAWALIKAGLVRGLSIGFRGIETQDIKGTWGQRFVKWEWLELSAVTIPANSEATIQVVKSIDEEMLRRAVSGHRAKQIRIVPPLPAVAGVSQQQQGATTVNIKEQIAGFEAKRAANAAAMQKLVADADGATLSTEQQQEFDNLAAENSEIDGHLKRLRILDTAVTDTIAGAKPVTSKAGTSEDESRRVRAGEGTLRPNANLPKGIGLARYAKAMAQAKGNIDQAIRYASQWEGSTPDVVEALKASVAAGTTTDASWAGPLVYSENLTSEFVEYLRPQTIIGKMAGLRRVPFNVRYPTQSAGASVGWVGQGAAKKVGKLTLSYGSLGFAKAAGIVVITQELARFSSPSAELMVRDDIAAEMQYFLDAQFIDPGVAASANVSPASVLNGASNVRQAAAVWNTAANVETDVKVFLSTFEAQEISLGGAYWVMTPDVALSLSMIRTTGGENFAYPGINVDGGTWFGLPVITSNAVPHSVSAGSIVALVKPSEVFLADDGAIAIDVSTEASLEMDSAPSGSSVTPTAAQLVSMFQTNSMAIRVERVINWSRRRTYGVGYIDNVHTS